MKWFILVFYIAVLEAALGMHNLYLFPCKSLWHLSRNLRKALFFGVLVIMAAFLWEINLLPAVFVCNTLLMYTSNHVVHQLGLSFHSLNCLLYVYLGNSCLLAGWTFFVVVIFVDWHFCAHSLNLFGIFQEFLRYSLSRGQWHGSF